MNLTVKAVGIRLLVTNLAHGRGLWLEDCSDHVSSCHQFTLAAGCSLMPRLWIGEMRSFSGFALILPKPLARNLLVSGIMVKMPVLKLGWRSGVLGSHRFRWCWSSLVPGLRAKYRETGISIIFALSSLLTQRILWFASVCFSSCWQAHICANISKVLRSSTLLMMKRYWIRLVGPKGCRVASQLLPYNSTKECHLSWFPMQRAWVAPLPVTGNLWVRDLLPVSQSCTTVRSFASCLLFISDYDAGFLITCIGSIMFTDSLVRM